MKINKISFLASLLLFFLINSQVHSQMKSKEELNRAIVESILNKDVEGFKALLLPKEVVMASYENDIPEGTSQEEKDEFIQQSEAAYDKVVIPRYESNFWEMVKLTEAHKIDWSNRDLMILYKYDSNDPEYNPFFIHTKLNNSVYKHFYFSAVRYKGEWYFEDQMELTKNEKYSARD